MPLFTFLPGRDAVPPALALPFPAPGTGSGERPQSPAAGRPVRVREGGTVSGPGRPQKPLPDGPAAGVAAELRRLRERAPLTFRALADDCGYSLATVTAACGGRRLPSWNVTRAIVRTCGGDEDAVRALYERACAAEGRPAPGSAEVAADPPDLAGVRTPAQLVACMIKLRTWAGSPSLAELNRRSGGHLPPSTVSGVLRRDGLPRRDLVARYSRACGLPGPAVSEWESAWDRVKATDTAGRAADAGESPTAEQPDAGPAPPPAQRTAPAAPLIARMIALILNLICLPYLVGAAIAPGTAALAASGAPQQAMALTVQVTGDYVFQGSLTRDDSRALAQSIALAAAKPPHQARRTINISAGAQVLVSNLLGAGGGPQHGAFLEALDVDGSGTVSATALTLGGLPAGTEVGLLRGAGHPLASCSTARWFTASSMPLVADSTVCIFSPASPGTASLLSVQKRSSRSIALNISSWPPQAQPDGTPASTSRAGTALQAP